MHTIDPAPWGIKVSIVEVKDVEIPADVSKRVEVRRWDGTPAFKGSYSEGRSAIAANVTQLIEELACIAIEGPFCVR